MQKHTVLTKNKTFPQFFWLNVLFLKIYKMQLCKNGYIFTLFLLPEVVWHWHLWGHILAVLARHALELCRVCDTHHLNIKTVYHSVPLNCVCPRHIKNKDTLLKPLNMKYKDDFSCPLLRFSLNETHTCIIWFLILSTCAARAAVWDIFFLTFSENIFNLRSI